MHTSMTVTASTTSFLCILEPGRSRSRTICVIPALYPAKAVRWTKLNQNLACNGRKGTWFLGIIFGESLDASAMTSSSLAREESKGPVTRCFKFSVTIQK